MIPAAMIRVEKTAWRGKPLAWLDGRLVVNRRGRLVIYSPGGSVPERRIPLPLPGWKAFFSRFRLTERLLHCDVRWAAALDDQNFLFPWQDGIYRLDVLSGELIREDVSTRGTPLSALSLAREGDPCPEIYMGDYHANPERGPMSIRRRDPRTGRWDVVYTFPAGTIKHIHGIVRDPYRQFFYILTGDEDSESGIWLAADDFSSVTPLCTGSQMVRSCQALPVPGGLYYLTDAPSEPNRVYRFAGGRAVQIRELCGSVIYGLPLGDGLLFSTTVEPDAHAPNRLSFRFTNRPGKGIRGKTVQICRLSPDGNVETLAEFTHDGLPFRLFQYGAATFCPVNENEALFAPCCVKKWDQRIFRVVLG